MSIQMKNEKKKKQLKTRLLKYCVSDAGITYLVSKKTKQQLIIQPAKVAIVDVVIESIQIYVYTEC